MRTPKTAVAALTTLALTAGGLAVVAPGIVEAAGPTIATLPTENPSNWTPNVLDGEVFSVWQIGGQVIIGGTFTQVANSDSNGGTVYNRTGVAAFDATTGVVDVDFDPVLDGAVEVVIPSADGTSVYIGGQFNTVDGANRRKVAKLNVATGARNDDFNINGVNGLVRDLRLVGNDLIVSGLFTSIGSQARAYLASVDATTGAVTERIDSSILGQHNGGVTKVIKTEVTPDGSRLLVIGNFTSIDDQPREQIALLDLTQTPATVTPWSTDFYTGTCAGVFDSYLRDLDISADGTFAVVSTTGAYRGADSPCDTIARMEIDAEVPDVDPTWVSSTGGDTVYAVEIHDGVAYVGGHMRWVNNPYAGDRHGAGGVAREGMAALDVVTGLPYSWNPGRTRGVGLFDFHVTEQGIWATSDTVRWNNELRMRLAFFPWAGGSDVTLADIGELPNDVFQLGKTTGGTGTIDPSVLYRVNAGGPALASVDDGPNWEADSGPTSPYRNSGSNSAIAPFGLTTPINHASVPSSDLDRVPTQVWIHERWDPTGGAEMEWKFPVAAGTPIEVRLYMANRCQCTNQRGERIFDVDLDGNNVIDELDLTDQYGHDVGAMRSFDIVSDGSVDILFRHGAADNPLVNAIEIVRRNGPTGGTFGEQDQVVRHQFDGVNPPTGTTTLPGQLPWRTVRSAFMADGALYTLHLDGQIMRRTVDGSNISFGTAIDMWSNNIMPDMANMTGLFYDPSTSSIYYTIAGQSSLYVREFVAESATIHAIRSTATGAINALDPTRVRGMFLGSGHLWFADASTGDLMKMPYAGGVVSGTPTVADDSVDWRGRALFRTTTSQPNIAPTADFTVTCDDNVCDVDGSISTDPDGTIVAHDWDFGDGTTGEGASLEHTYTAAGTYTITLTVTDDRGGTAQHQEDVTVDVIADPNDPPTASFTPDCTILSCTFDGTSSTDSDGTIVSYDWDFGDEETGSGPTPSHEYTTSGTYTVRLEVTDNDGATSETELDITVAGNTAPTASFTSSCTGPKCNFDSSASNDPDGTIASRTWDFGDGSTASGTAPSHTYAASGTYTVTLTVTDDDGATTETQRDVTVTVDGAPTASFTLACTALTCSFDSSASTDPGGSIVARDWTFGDGSAGSGRTPTHTYTSPGTYRVRLTVTDDDGMSAAVSRSVTVPKPGTPPPSAGDASALTSVTPFRLFDTRPGEPAPGPKGIVGADAEIDVAVAGVGSIPDDVTAVAVNLTVVALDAPSFVTAWPAGTDRPTELSSLNVITPGSVRANLAIVPVGADGDISLYTLRDAHLLGDVVGYFTESGATSAGRIITQTPQRLFDTRPGPEAGPKGAVPSGGTIAVDVAGEAGVPATGASAVIVNLTVTETTAPSFVTAWPEGTRPATSSVNMNGAGETVANMVIVPIGADGKIRLYALSSTHVLADVLGYVTGTSAPSTTKGLFVPIDPTRLFDTRPGEPAAGPKGMIGSNTSITTEIASVGGIPATAGGVVLNLTYLSTAPGFITMWPTGAPRPGTSSVNASIAGDVRPNGAILRLGAGGDLDAYALTAAHLLGDASGYLLD